MRIQVPLGFHLMLTGQSFPGVCKGHVEFNDVCVYI